jgi:predicted nucleic acid-binding protein
MKPAVSDSSPLISLARIGRLDLLQGLFHEIWVPPAVEQELTPKGKKKGASALRAATWIKVQDLSLQSLKPVSSSLGRGERAAIALAREKGLELLMDDPAGRREAARLGVPVLGTVGLLLEAKAQSLIPEVKPLLDALLAEGFRLSPRLYERILRRAKESKKSSRA